MNKTLFKSMIIALVLVANTACKNVESDASEQEEIATTTQETESALKISLAQWSLHQRYRDEGQNPFHFARDAKAMGFDAIEYVSQLYTDALESMTISEMIDSLKQENMKYDIKPLLIMVDDEGDLAHPDAAMRDQAVEQHKKWVDVAAALGCHSIRVNTFGTNEPEPWVENVQLGLKALSEYAADKGVNVLVENHGWLSSDAPRVVEAIKGVNMENCGTLPDFGNWCIKRDEGENWGACLEEYHDYYEGLELLMPLAKAVSAKSYDFDANGDETKLDYYRMMKIVVDAGYEGYVGVEYEGDRLSEVEGIEATRKLIEKALGY